MKVLFIPSTCSGDASLAQYLTSFVINDRIAIDAGALGFWQTPADQAAIRHVFLSHTHMDHVASLPIFLENVAAFHETPVTIYASDVVQESLRLDLFNGRVWANFLELTHERGRFADLVTIANGQTIAVEGVRVTPVAVDHAVPTLGFILEDATSAVAIVSDTGPTEEIWRRASQTPNLKAVFLEATFPNDMANLAALTRHLTPAGFATEMAKLSCPAAFYAVHMRARCLEQVTLELLALGRPNLHIAKSGKAYEF